MFNSKKIKELEERIRTIELNSTIIVPSSDPFSVFHGFETISTRDALFLILQKMDMKITVEPAQPKKYQLSPVKNTKKRIQ